MLEMTALVLAPPNHALLYIGHYDPLLVSLSVVIAIFAAFAALQVSQQVAQNVAATQATARRLWIAVGGISMGAGIWAMHFVGMLALSLPCATTYDPLITLLTLIPGILASTLAISIISRPAISSRQLASGALLLGVGIGTMHYSGMAAYRLDGLIRYDLKLFLLSLVVAVVLAALALWFKFWLQQRQRPGSMTAQVGGAVVLGLAISAMHYTGMAAAYFIRDGDGAVVSSQMSPSFLASLVLVVTSAIIVITLMATLMTRPTVFAFQRGFKLVGALVLGWSLAAWLAADYYTGKLQDDVTAQETRIARQQALTIAGNIGDSLKAQQGIPVALSHHHAILEVLRSDAAISTRPPAERTRHRTQDAQFAHLNTELAVIAAALGSDVAWVMNAAGDCIAASNAETETSFVGTNYSDRDYFRQARAGQAGWQYAIGKRTRVPGLFFSYPVMDRNRVAGVVAVKRDIADFSHMTGAAHVFVADANGVIVLSDDKRLEFQTLAEATVHRLAEAEQQLLYLRTTFEPLPLRPWKQSRLPQVLQIGNSLEPAVLASATIPGYALSVHVPRAVPDLVRLETEQFWLFVLLAVAGDMLIIAVAALLLYLYSIRLARDAAADAGHALEKLVVTRTTELEKARDAAESANRAKSIFLANMSHELRTPLNAILGFAQILERDASLTSHHSEIATINRSGRHLLALINNILEISRIEAGRTVVRREAFDLPGTIAAVEEMVRSRAEAKDLQLRVEISAGLTRHVVGDDHRLRQVLINLLGNAVKYTDQGEVSLRVDPAADDGIRFAVTDTGPGITAEEQKHLFQAFYQTAAGIARGEGTGLGLSITREFIHLMGGELTVESEPGKGSTFAFTVPLPPAAAPASTPRQSLVTRLQAGQNPVRILIAEDHPESRELLDRLLSGAGFEIRTADNGQLAVEAFTAWKPHFIWMDMRMPLMDGYAATRAIRALPGGRDVKIVALTASAFEEDRAAIIAAGCDDLASKPIEQDKLFALLGRLLNLRFDYMAAAAVPQESASAEIGLSGLPGPLCQELLTAADHLDAQAVRTIVARIGSEHPQIARVIAELADDYRLDKIAELCRRAEGNR